MLVKAAIHNGVNGVLRPLGVQLVRGFSADPAVKPFVSAKKTMTAARRAGLSVGDYIDGRHAVPGATATTVDAMLRLAALTSPVSRVCEIGPGTGRYAERVIAELRPEVYEIYETASDWLPRLRQLPHVKVQSADGHTLGPTAAGSVDLVHAHKLFVYIPLVITVGYLQEMARVVRPGGAVAFDIVTEACMDEDVTQSWVSQNAVIYSMISRQWTIDLLRRRGLVLVGSAFVPLVGGKTELLVFRRS
jgi:phospholipid N-methyltransferase